MSTTTQFAIFAREDHDYTHLSELGDREVAVSVSVGSTTLSLYGPPERLAAMLTAMLDKVNEHLPTPGAFVPCDQFPTIEAWMEWADYRQDSNGTWRDDEGHPLDPAEVYAEHLAETAAADRAVAL